MHELANLEQVESRAGYLVVVWACTCGRRGKGSRKTPEAQAGWIKHARGRALRDAGYAPPRRSPRTSRDW